MFIVAPGQWRDTADAEGLHRPDKEHLMVIYETQGADRRTTRDCRRPGFALLRDRRAMGRRNYLIEGVSGAGKTAVGKELQRRGYQVIHGDRELAYRGDPETGRPMIPETDTPTAIWLSKHHIWDVEKVKAYVANQEEAATFLCGGSRNHAKFIDLFDRVFILDVDVDTMQRRLCERVALDPTDFGRRPEERELAVRLHQTKEGVPKNGTIIDATAPLERVVDEIIHLSEADKAF